jgi:hypothetical protein
VLYDAAFQGLYRSTDGAQSWQPVEGALGQVPVYSLAVAETDDRIILYAGTAGGIVVLTDTVGILSEANTGVILVNAGVYRYTTVRLTERVWLPLVVR